MTLVVTLSLAGTAAFGLSGGLAAFRARLDMFGMAVVASAVALGGGIVRDLLIGVPPQTFRDWRYLAVAAAAGFTCFFFGSAIERVERAIDLFDALGLSLFCVTGASAALSAGVPPIEAAVLGTITGIGGGVLRDVLLRQVPTVLTHDLYAVPALIGATTVTLARTAHLSGGIPAIIAAALALPCV